MNNPLLCLICSAKTKGRRLKVISCRACAMFYRRSVKKSQEYRCDSNTFHCIMVKKKGQLLCKYCRFQRCQQLGMDLKGGRKPRTINNKDYIVDVAIETTKLNNKLVIPSIPDDKNPKMHTLSTINIETSKIIIDLHSIEAMVKQILKEPKPTSITTHISLTSMQEINFGFSIFLEKTKPTSQIVVSQEADQYQHVKYYENYMIELAEVLTYCKQFVKFTFEDKFSLYKNLVPNFFFIERVYASIIYGTSFEDSILLYSNHNAVNSRDDDVHITDVNIDEFNKVKPLWFQLRDKVVNNIMNPMKQLRITQFEIVYLLVYMIFDHDIGNLSMDATKIIEDIMEQVATELHTHYIQEMRLTNYAHRLIKLNKIIEASKEIQFQKQENSVLAKIFNMLHFEIVGSELSWAV